MGKKLNDWLDEFVVNGANPNEVPEWPDNVSGGGIELVDTLPQVGEESKLYKLPNGSVFSCINSVKTVEVNDLIVGHSYTFNEDVLARKITNLCSYTDSQVVIDFDDTPTTHHLSIVTEWGEAIIDKVTYGVDNNIAQYSVNRDNQPEKARFTLSGFEEIPTVIITQYFVNQLIENNLSLDMIAFLFVGGSHEEEQTFSTWTELGVNNGYNFKCTGLHSDSIIARRAFGETTYSLLSDLSEFRIEPSIYEIPNVLFIRNGGSGNKDLISGAYTMGNYSKFIFNGESLAIDYILLDDTEMSFEYE